MEREKDDADEAEREANLQESLTDRSKVVKLIVDKWFVDKGFGFGKTHIGRNSLHPRQLRARRRRAHGRH